VQKNQTQDYTTLTFRLQQVQPDIDNLVYNDLDIFTRLHHVKAKKQYTAVPKNADHAQPFTQYRGHFFILTDFIT